MPTERAQVIWDSTERGVSSVLVDIEARAALAKARQHGRFDDGGHEVAIRQWDQLLRQLYLVQVDGVVVEQAGELVAMESLRAYDAVHLASALLMGASEVVMATGDHALAEASGRCGIGVADLHAPLRNA